MCVSRCDSFPASALQHLPARHISRAPPILWKAFNTATAVHTCYDMMGAESEQNWKTTYAGTPC